MQIKNEKRLKKVLIVLVLMTFSIAGGDVALVGMHHFSCEYTVLIDALWRDGHRPFGVSDTFVDPPGFDTYWIFPDEELTDINIAKLYTFVCSGGHLILVPDCRGYLVGPTNRIFEYEPWFEELGEPQAYNEFVRDSYPDFYYGGGASTSFILNFDNRWIRGSGIDTLLTGDGVSVGLESDGCLSIVGCGARDCYGHPYDADTAVYDSFAVQILAGFYGSGELTVVADINLFANYPHYYGWTDFITTFDNLQFARQLFACNTRADSAGIEQADSTFRVYLHGDFTDFDPDSSEWKFRILHVWPPYEFRGHEIGARFVAPNILEIDKPPIYNPVYDTVEVCLMFLPDYDGETVLWDFPVCDTFVFDFSNIAETPTPQSFAISTHPNPFNSAVTITIDGAGVCDTPLRLEIYDVAGRIVDNLPVGEGLKPSRSLTVPQTGGSETTPLRNDEFIWHPDESLPSGVYLVRIVQGGLTYAKPVVYVK
jgi:hypothetical protein